MQSRAFQMSIANKKDIIKANSRERDFSNDKTRTNAGFYFLMRSKRDSNHVTEILNTTLVNR
jgi:hypothetical protein